jgi:hypothetical protein
MTMNSVEALALRVCKALHIETNGRHSWPAAIHTVGYRPKVSEDELHDPIYYAKMKGGLSTGGVPVHSVWERRGEVPGEDN